MKKNPFNTDKKSNKNYALLNGLIVDIENSKFIKGTILIKDRLIEDFGSHIKVVKYQTIMKKLIVKVLSFLLD